MKIWKTENCNENENRNETGEDTYAGALRAPRAGSPAFVSVFVFVLIYGSISFIMNHIFYYDVKSRREIIISVTAVTITRPTVKRRMTA